MFLKKVEGPRCVTLSDGQVMTRADLPPANTKRWVASRKAAVVRGVAYGLITKREALETYGTCEVLTGKNMSWQSDFIEAQAFAYLAVRTVKGMPITFPGTTGIKVPSEGGVIIGGYLI